MPGAPAYRRFPQIEGLRGIAAIAVLVTHVASAHEPLELGQDAPLVAQLGISGVVVFFVISGFVLYRPFVAARAGPGSPGRVAAVLPPAGAAYRPRLLAGAPCLRSRRDGDRSGARPRCADRSVVRVLRLPPGLSPGHLAPRPWRRLDVVRGGHLLRLPSAARAVGRPAWARWRGPGAGAHAAGRHRGAFDDCAGADRRAGTQDEYLSATLPFCVGWFATGMALALVSVEVEREPAVLVSRASAIA